MLLAYSLPASGRIREDGGRFTLARGFGQKPKKGGLIWLAPKHAAALLRELQETPPLSHGTRRDANLRAKRVQKLLMMSG